MITRDGTPNRCCSPCSTGLGSASASPPCEGLAESPKPGKSGASTQRPDSTSAAILRNQCVQLPLPPCSSATGARFGLLVRVPQWCQTMVPLPQGVSTRVAVFKCAWASTGNSTDSKVIPGGLRLGHDSLVFPRAGFLKHQPDGLAFPVFAGALALVDPWRTGVTKP